MPSIYIINTFASTRVPNSLPSPEHKPRGQLSKTCAWGLHTKAGHTIQENRTLHAAMHTCSLLIYVHISSGTHASYLTHRHTLTEQGPSAVAAAPHLADELTRGREASGLCAVGLLDRAHAAHRQLGGLGRRK